ncbi:hypothetical protein Glove_707g67 [Diversispora epigaea]|uniref:Uncharacterized protein n=1 Tax=Diversispora epigaea TaxID=1348612 RepID=A0A397G1W0_9GLOM|nr:hypothetical protein Glove_707g67 [Diversispora epigaea]
MSPTLVGLSNNDSTTSLSIKFPVETITHRTYYTQAHRGHGFNRERSSQFSGPRHGNPRPGGFYVVPMSMQ